jgi:hypothetical protein
LRKHRVQERIEGGTGGRGPHREQRTIERAEGGREGRACKEKLVS